MGLDVIYSSQASQHRVRFTEDEWTCLSAIGRIAPDAAGVLFDFPDFGEPVPVDSGAIVAASDELLRLIRDRRELAPAAYQFRMENWMGTGMRGDWSGGAASGIRLQGDPDHVYMLDTRDGRCTLQKIRLKDQQTISREDIGHLTTMQTESFGCIEIRAQGAGAELSKKLTAIRVFATSALPQQLTKLMA